MKCHPITCLIFACSLLSILSAQNPSLEPIKNEGGFAERYRIRFDLNNDEKEDLILSEPIYSFDNSVGNWRVYIQDEAVADKFREIGEFSGHPQSIAIEHDPDQDDRGNRYYHRIWTYIPSSERLGKLNLYSVSNDSVDESAQSGIVISGGEVSTLSGRKLYQAIFEKSHIAMITEKSRTSKQGVVSWERFRTNRNRDSWSGNFRVGDEETIYVRIESGLYIAQQHKAESKDGELWIDGVRAVGTDGAPMKAGEPLPKVFETVNHVTSLQVRWGRQEIDIQKSLYSGVFDPRFSRRRGVGVVLSPDGQAIEIGFHGSDGAGFYSGSWVLRKNGKHERKF